MGGVQERLKNELIGSSNESRVIIEGIETSALIDTGSCVSTVSETFFRTSLQDIELHQVKEVINIECADGQQLPYIGVIEAELEVIGVPTKKKQSCLLLVIPDSDFSKNTPLLIGTNVITELMSTCKEHTGTRYLQNAALFTPWYLAFRAMTLNDKELKRNHNRLALIKSAENNTVWIKPNSSIELRAYTCHRITYKPTAALIEQSEEAAIHPDLDISPTLVNYDSAVKDTLKVHVSYITTRTVAVSPNAILAQLTPVTIDQVQLSTEREEHEDFLDKINIENSDLSEEQIDKIKETILRHHDIFSKNDTDIGHYRGVTHKINLHDDRPFKQRYRRIPPAMVDEVRQHIEQLLSTGIIRKSHSPYSSNVVLVRKKDGKIGNQ